jgi:hypothetical protein
MATAGSQVFLWRDIHCDFTRRLGMITISAKIAVQSINRKNARQCVFGLDSYSYVESEL